MKKHYRVIVYDVRGHGKSTHPMSYYLKDIINHLNYKQPQVVKAVKNLSQEDYFDKKRNEHDERTVLILVNATQRTKIDELLNRVNKRIEEANKETEL